VYVLVKCIRNNHIPGTFRVTTYASHDLESLKGRTDLTEAKWTEVLGSCSRQNVPPGLQRLTERHLLCTPPPARQFWNIENGQWNPAGTRQEAVIDEIDLTPALLPPELKPPERVPRTKNLPDTFIATDASGRGTWAAIIRSAEGTFKIGGHNPYQNIHLAELYAIVRALEWLPANARHVRLVTDSESATWVIGKKTRKPADAELRDRYLLSARRHRIIEIKAVPRRDERIKEADQLAAELGLAIRTAELQATPSGA